MPNSPVNKLVRFGPFELDLATADLYRGQRKVRLPEQQFQVLEILLRGKGELVSREQIRKRLWPNDTVVEFDVSINSTIRKLRAALGDSADQPQFIETVARRGYRIMVAVDFPYAAPPADSPTKTVDGSLVGQRVSHYRVLQVLGGGGMGVVYKAEDIKLGRAVALKFLPEELMEDSTAKDRIEREARAASTLNHPNICTIYEVEEHQGQPFIAMELMEGRTLRDMLSGVGSNTLQEQHESVPIDSLVDIALQIVSGLDAAHNIGMIHRDIKPANIFVTIQGRAKILDFGLAKLHAAEAADPPDQRTAEPGANGKSNQLLTLTRTGATVGTAAYMSPEQVRGEKLDPRTDLFSFGLVLYEMATGQRAFGGDTAAILQEEILYRAPAPPRQLNPKLPGRLDIVINKLLSKDRESRYQSAREVRSDLETLNRTMKPARVRWRTAAAIVAGLSTLTSTWIALRKHPAPAPRTELRLRQLTSNSNENPVIGGAISPDGKYLEYSDLDGLHLKLLGSSEISSIPAPKGLRNIGWDRGFWFPDSTSFVVTAHPSAEELQDWNSATASIWKVSVLGAPPTRLRDHAVAWSISPDGTNISFGANRGKLGEREAWLMGSSGEQARKIFEFDDSRAIDRLRWSPDGTRYLYALLDHSGTRMMSRELSGGAPVTLLLPAEMERISDMVWLRDGSVVYDWSETYTKGAVCNYWKLQLDWKSGRRRGAPERVTNWPDVCMNWPDLCISGSSLTRDERTMTFARSTDFVTTYMADMDNRTHRIKEYTRFTLDDATQFVGEWSADGKSTYVFDYLNHFRMLERPLTGGPMKTIIPSFHASWVQIGEISPDGKWFIARIWPEDRQPLPVPPQPVVPFPLVRIPLAGGPPETIMQLSLPITASCARTHSNLCVIAEQSENHKQMIVTAFDIFKGRGVEIVPFDLDRNREIFADMLVCVLSPDGARLAFRRSSDGPVEIYSLREHTTRTVPSSAWGQTITFRWTADSQGFFVTRKVPSGSELVHMDFQGRVTPLRNCLEHSCVATVSPDGHHVAVTERKKTMNMWMMENF